MPPVTVVFYREEDGTILMEEWLEGLQSQPKHRTKCIKYLMELQNHGHDLGRPTVGTLRDGIYELRVSAGFENYRMLFFFHGSEQEGTERAVVTHGITKHTKKVPPKEIDKAVRLSREYERDPESHTFNWEP